MIDYISSDKVIKKVLIVDDNKDICHLLGHILEEAGYQIFYANNGLQALTQAQSQQPDLILMDLSLPELDGWEVLKRLRNQPMFSHIPIIALTAFVNVKTHSKALAAGFSYYLPKPFQINEMLKVIAELLQFNASPPPPSPTST
jgi:CheY-like chemotaxis protein